jgi:hypothetical protein
MLRFNYQARNLTGQKVGGVMLADSEEQLAVTLREMDLYLVAARPESAEGPTSLVGRRVKRRELINFTIHLSTSIGAGIPILQSFQDIADQTTNPRMKKAIGLIVEDLSGGSSLSDALSRHPLIFSDVYVSMVNAGEVSGSLDKVLERLIDFLEWQDALASGEPGQSAGAVDRFSGVAGRARIGNQASLYLSGISPDRHSPPHQPFAGIRIPQDSSCHRTSERAFALHHTVRDGGR